jgi:hypothetical protein
MIGDKMCALDTRDQSKLKDILHRAKAIACEYYQFTGKPLGLTGEVAELEAADKLGLVLVPARTPFYDGIRNCGGTTEKFQIKGRAVDRSRPYRGRVSAIKCDGEFDAVLLVLMDRMTFEAIEIWQADRIDVSRRLKAPGSKARNERNSIGIAQFKSIAVKVWPK